MFQVVETTISSSNAQNAQGIGATIQEAYKLPAEFHHFYYGSQVDLGALIEVKRKSSQRITGTSHMSCYSYANKLEHDPAPSINRQLCDA